jgi:hypothetical protein
MDRSPSCRECCYRDRDISDDPCIRCALTGDGRYPHFVERRCENCLVVSVLKSSENLRSCAKCKENGLSMLVPVVG